MSENNWRWYAGSARLLYLNTLGMGLPWITLRDSNGTPSAWTVLFSTYATSCVSAFCTEAKVELVVLVENLVETPEDD